MVIGIAKAEAVDKITAKMVLCCQSMFRVFRVVEFEGISGLGVEGVVRLDRT